MTTPTEDEYRQALWGAQRALMHASKLLALRTKPQGAAQVLIDDALHEVSRVLDIGRDETDEMILT